MKKIGERQGVQLLAAWHRHDKKDIAYFKQ